MIRTALTVCATVVCAGLTVAEARAALVQDQFPPHTTGDLIALCNAGKDDPMMTAAVNFCNGFVEGVVELALGYESVVRNDRQPFCLPAQRPSHNEAVAQFSAWANAEPKRLEEPPSVGLVRYLAHQYPCPHSMPHKAGAK
jgi:hypothetical protein